MRKVILAMQMSLDGFIEGPDGAMDWLVSGEEELKLLESRPMKSGGTVLWYEDIKAS